VIRIPGQYRELLYAEMCKESQRNQTQRRGQAELILDLLILTLHFRIPGI
jgi:hypothetical protein